MTPSTPTQFTCVCKLAYYPLSDANDEVRPSNIGALRLGLEALTREDVGDFNRSKVLWREGRALLSEESEDDVGAQSQGIVSMDDSFDLGCLGDSAGFELDW